MVHSLGRQIRKEENLCRFVYRKVKIVSTVLKLVVRMNDCVYTYLASSNLLCLVSRAPQILTHRVLLKKKLIHQLISRFSLDILAKIV